MSGESGLQVGGFDILVNADENSAIVGQIVGYLKIPKEQASRFFQNTMIYTHGLASYIASGIITSSKEVEKQKNRFVFYSLFLMFLFLWELFHGALWGVAHAPLIYFGMNYGLNYAGAPYSGIAMMILFGMTIGVYMSFVTLRTNNCMYAAIIHGTVNIIGETPIFVSLATQNILLGPNPSGIIGMSVLLIGAVILLSVIKEPDAEDAEFIHT